MAAGAPALVTARLTLNAVKAGDAPRFAALANNWNVARWLARLPYPYTLDHARAFCEIVARTAKTGQDFIWAIRELSDGGPLGVISVGGLSEEKPELGYWLGEPYWGRGLMSEAARAVVDAFFTRTAHGALYSGAFVGNEASWRIQLKLGFRETGRHRRWCLARGADLDHLDSALTRADWTSRR